MKKTRLFLVTGNKHKVDAFKMLMDTEYHVGWFRPTIGIQELASRSVQQVVDDKLDKAFEQFKPGHNAKDVMFVTDVGFHIEQLHGRPGAMIKRETSRLFGGDFSRWCSCLNPSKTRAAHITILIAGRNNASRLIVKQTVRGTVPLTPLNGPYGFDWDNIFVPEPAIAPAKYRGKSFAQMPERVKFRILMDSAIRMFKLRLAELRPK